MSQTPPTPTEQAIIDRLARGDSYTAIARDMGLTCYAVIKIRWRFAGAIKERQPKSKDTKAAQIRLAKRNTTHVSE